LLPETTVIGRGTNLHVQHGTDDNLLVRFYWNAVAEEHFIRINVPGDSNSEWDRKVTDKDKARWPDKWEAYSAKQSQAGGQVTLEDAGIFHEARIKIYKNFNIETVNQLAGLNDGFISNIGMGAREDVKKANAWLQEQSSKRTETELNRALQKRDDEIALLKEQMKQLLSAPKGKTKEKQSDPTI